MKLGNKRLGVVLVAILVSGSLLTGCGSQQEAGVSPSPRSSQNITAFIQYADITASIWKGWGASKLYEDTGLALELYSTDAQVEQKLKQYMVSGAIPDIIGFQNSEQAKLYMDAGILLPLNEYEEYLPSVFQDEAYAQALKYSSKYINTDSNDLLLLPVSVGEMAADSYRSIPMLQESAWQKAGEPELATLEDYLDAVDQMMKAKPLSNTGEVMYGISLYQNDAGMAAHVAALAYLYGIDIYTVSPLMETDMNTGEIGTIFQENSFYKRALHFYYEANKRGLLDADSASQTYSNLERKITSGRVMLTWSPEMAESYNVLQRSYGDTAGRADGYAAHLAEDMKLYRDQNHIVGNNQYLAVNRYSAHVEEACQLLNWLYDEETIFYLYNGPEDIIWSSDPAGMPYVTEAGQRIVDTGEEFPGEIGSLLDGIRPFGELPRTEASLTKAGYSLSYRYWREQEDVFTAELEEAGQFVDATSAVYMVETVPAELGQQIERIRESVDEYAWAMIYADNEAEFETLWQEMKTSAESQGMLTVETFYRGAWRQARALEERLQD